MSRDQITFAVHTLLEELRQMKDEGIQALNLEESTLDSLKRVVQPLAQVVPTPSPDIPKPQILPAPQSPQPVSVDPPSLGSPTLPSSRGILPQETSSVPVTKQSVLSNSVAASGDLTPPIFELPSGTKEERMEWLRQKVLNCPTCLENKNPERHLAFGVGNLDADIFLCGEAPGEEEEKQGEPFVGPAGQKLTGMLKGMGLSREQVYIGNILKWRPKTETGFGNRAPSPEEMDFCLPYLNAQIAIVQPKIILALGNTAIRGLLGHDDSLKVGKIHGTWYEYKSIPLMPTFHPSYILHNDTKRTKRMVWEDLLKVMEKLELSVSDKQRSFFL